MTDLRDFESLYAACGSESEYDLLDQLIERAGMIWACRSCHWRNPADAIYCEHCSKEPVHVDLINVKEPF